MEGLGLWLAGLSTMCSTNTFVDYTCLVLLTFIYASTGRTVRVPRYIIFCITNPRFYLPFIPASHIITLTHSESFCQSSSSENPIFSFITPIRKRSHHNNLTPKKWPPPKHPQTQSARPLPPHPHLLIPSPQQHDHVT